MFCVGSTDHLEDIFDAVDRLQQFRLDDQRTNFPNLTNSTNTNRKNPRLSPVNEQFLDQLARCQVCLSIFFFFYVIFN